MVAGAWQLVVPAAAAEVADADTDD
jgi:hypothetical protein